MILTVHVRRYLELLYYVELSCLKSQTKLANGPSAISFTTTSTTSNMNSREADDLDITCDPRQQRKIKIMKGKYYKIMIKTDNNKKNSSRKNQDIFDA